MGRLLYGGTYVVPCALGQCGANHLNDLAGEYGAGLQAGFERALLSQSIEEAGSKEIAGTGGVYHFGNGHGFGKAYLFCALSPSAVSTHFHYCHFAQEIGRAHV